MAQVGSKKIKVRLLGVYGRIAKRSELEIGVRGSSSLKSLLEKVCTQAGPSFREALLDPELKDPGVNALILVNEREISALQGLNTKVKPGDSVVIVPVTHGG